MMVMRHRYKLIFAAFILLGCLCYYWYRQGRVRPFFSWLTDRDDFSCHAELVYERKEWCLVYKLTNDKMLQMLKEDFSNEGYMGWKRFHGGWGLWLEQDVINGAEHEVWINQYWNATENSMICMFMEIDRCYLVLFYGRTN